MPNRMTNGSYSPPDMLSRRKPRESQRSQSGSDKANFEQPMIEKFGNVVKKSPGVTLLVALAAGVAIGWLVKRS